MARRVPADLVLALRGYALRDATTLTATSLFTLKSDPMGSQEISNDDALWFWFFSLRSGRKSGATDITNGHDRLQPTPDSVLPFVRARYGRHARGATAQSPQNALNAG
jgi:hypothetical protein